MAKKIKTMLGTDGYDYPISSPKLIIDEEGNSIDTKISDIIENSIEVERISGNTDIGAYLNNSIIDLVNEGIKTGSSNAANNTAILHGLIKKYPNGDKVFYFKYSSDAYYFNPIDFTDMGSGEICVKLKGENEGLDGRPGKRPSINTRGQDFLYDKRTEGLITFYVEDLTFYSHLGFGGTPSGVCFGRETNNGTEYNFHFYNVHLHGFDYGFKSPGYSCALSGGRNIILSENHYGIYIGSTSHCFNIEDIQLNYNRVGIRFGFGGDYCKVKNIHFALGYFGTDKNDYERFIGIHCKGSVEIDGAYFEAYGGTETQPEKQILIDYEGHGGLKPVIIKDIPIGKMTPNGGELFLRGATYLSVGPECSDNYTPISSCNKDYFRKGCVFMENCPTSSDISSLISIADNNQGYGYLLNGRNYCSDGLMMTHPAVDKLYSHLVPSLLGTTTETDTTWTYEKYSMSDFTEPYEGFLFHDLKVWDQRYGNNALNIYGCIEVEDTLSENLDVELGIRFEYRDTDSNGDTISGSKFYIIKRLKSDTDVGQYYFNIKIDDFSSHGIPSLIRFVSRYKGSSTKLKSSDFTKILFNIKFQHGKIF